MSAKCIRPPLINLPPGEHKFTDAVFRLPNIIQPSDNCWIRWRPPSYWELVPDNEKNMYERLEGEHPGIASVQPEDARYVVTLGNTIYEPAYHVGEGNKVTVYKRKLSSIHEEVIARPRRQVAPSVVSAPPPPRPPLAVRQVESPEQRAERERLGREEAERIRAARREAERQKAEIRELATAAAREQRIRENRLMKREFEERLRSIEERKQAELAQKPTFAEELERTNQTLRRQEFEKERVQTEQREETERWARLSRERREQNSVNVRTPTTKDDTRAREIMNAASAYFESQPRALTTDQREKIARALQKTREAWLTRHDPTHPDFTGRRRRLSLKPRGEQSLPPTGLMCVSPPSITALNHTDIGMEGIVLGVNPMFATSKIEETVRAVRSSRNTALQTGYRHRNSSILQLVCFAAIIAALSSAFVFGMMALALVQPRARLDGAIADVQLPEVTDARDFAAAGGSLALANEFALELDEAFNMQPRTWEMTDVDAVRVVQETWCPALENVLWGLSNVEGALQDEDNSFYMMLAKLCKEIQDGRVSESQAAAYVRNIEGGINCMLFNQYEGRFDASEQCPAAPLVNSAVAVSNSLLHLSQAAGMDLTSAATHIGAILFAGAAGILFSAVTGGSAPPIDFQQFGRGRRRRTKKKKDSKRNRKYRTARR